MAAVERGNVEALGIYPVNAAGTTLDHSPASGPRSRFPQSRQQNCPSAAGFPKRPCGCAPPPQGVSRARLPLHHHAPSCSSAFSVQNVSSRSGTCPVKDTSWPVCECRPEEPDFHGAAGFVVVMSLHKKQEAPEMTVTTFSSREFNQDTSRAKKAAVEGPVFITDRGKPAHVLLSIDDYRRLTHRPRKMEGSKNPLALSCSV
ncbi:hypothetical protein GOX2688 (plasmid) [Gluconobacter oxydans 621H]|uniref:Antitoxin n=2 Tax=Gluconobacter oxydans TaxID=442 RepID=Q5HXK1_GLUOX|nr:hypothetical protein GOX2688 [Gluconobacter oxydans 621H]